jgi:hypothetical protein
MNICYSAINHANEWDTRNHLLKSSTFVFKNVNFYSTKNVYVTYIIYTISICFLIIDKLYYLFLALALFGINLLKLILAEKIDHTEQGSKINYEVQKGVQFRRML